MVVKIADPYLMREINKYHVLETIRCFGQISRVEIADRTQLSATTVSAITAALIDEGLIEAIHQQPPSDGQRGRPRVLLDLVRDAAYVVGIKISETLVTTTIANFRGEAVVSMQSPIRVGRQTSDVIVDLIEDAVQACLAKSTVSPSKIKGVGIGIPGVVHNGDSGSHVSPIFGPREMSIATLLEARLGLPVRIERPAHLVALAESWFGYAQGNQRFAVVTVDQTASLALWIQDEVHRGANSSEPAFAHIKVGGDGRRCSCGQIDCLNAYVEIGAFAAVVRTALGAEDVPEGMAASSVVNVASARARSGDVAAIALFDEQGEKLGIAISHVINSLNPEKIIVAIENVTFRELISESLRRAAKNNSFKSSFESTELIFDTLEEQLWARGAAALVLRDIYSAPWTTAE